MQGLDVSREMSRSAERGGRMRRRTTGDGGGAVASESSATRPHSPDWEASRLPLALPNQHPPIRSLSFSVPALPLRSFSPIAFITNRTNLGLSRAGLNTSGKGEWNDVVRGKLQARLGSRSTRNSWLVCLFPNNPRSAISYSGTVVLYLTAAAVYSCGRKRLNPVCWAVTHASIKNARSTLNSFSGRPLFKHVGG